MAYTKHLWVARIGTRLNRFLKVNETTEAVDLVNEPEEVTQEGTPFSADIMNEMETGIADAHSLIGNLSTAVAGKVSGGVFGSFGEAGIAIESITSPNAMILAISAGSELWVQMNSSQASTLYTNHVLPVNNPGVLHIVRPGNGGRCLLEHYADNSKHYHYETSNVSSESGVWYVDTSTPA